MESQSLQHQGGQPSLYQDVRISFTPSFFSNGWECMLTPIHEHANTHVETSGNIRITLSKIQQMLLKVKELGRKAGRIERWTAIARLFL